MKTTTIIALVLLLVGAFNWLLVGVASFDVVAWIFGAGSVLARIVYALVGAAAAWMIIYWALDRPLRRV